MATTTTESLSELERRAETTRAELAQTVDALHNRVSPGAIKADVKNYVRDNPLQAAAIAVGVAYPVWRILGRIPAPVLMIGAGLAMARGGGANGSHARHGHGADGAGMAASGSGGPGMVETLKEKASDLGSQISEKAQQTIESVRSLASETAARASGVVSDTYRSARETTSGTAGQLSEQAHLVAEQAGETYARTRDSVADMIERHPFVAGGIALAVGSLVASTVPLSRPENRMLGATSDDIKRRGTDMARQGLRQAQSAAQQVYDTASSEIAEKGFTPEAARGTARAAVETAREAMEQGAGGTQQSGR